MIASRKAGGTEAGPPGPPGDHAAPFRLCCQLLELGDPRANAMLPGLAQVQWAPGWFELGATLRRLDQRQAAVAAFARAVAIDPGLAAAWFALGGVRQDLRDPEGAADAYRAALRARPDLHEAAFNLGVALLDCGRLDDALRAFARALETRPESLGRIAQALVSGPTGCLWLEPDGLRRALLA